MADGLLAWTYSGVDFQLAGNGGKDCASFVPIRQRIIETVLMIIISGVEMAATFRSLVLTQTPRSQENNSNHRHGGSREEKGELGKRILLVALCLIFGIELGFKFATRQLIWLLNPCHVVTILQIYLLTAQPSRLVQAIFRVHIHLLSGATIALIFPVLNTRMLTFEKEAYVIQHGLMLVIPAYLMSTGGIYTVESLLNFHWVVFSMGLNFFYHFAFLQFIGQMSLVNLNSMLCPAVSDPFYGPYYRAYACIHQTALILIHGKIYTLIAKLLLCRTVSHDVAPLCHTDNTLNLPQDRGACANVHNSSTSAMSSTDLLHSHDSTPNNIQKSANDHSTGVLCRTLDVSKSQSQYDERNESREKEEMEVSRQNSYNAASDPTIESLDSFLLTNGRIKKIE